MRYTFFLTFIILISCDTEIQFNDIDEVNIPLSIANNFTMTYTDSSKVKSYVSGNKHFDYSNNILNYSEFFDNVELIIYDDNKTSTIKSDYAIIFNSFRFMEFKGNVEITTSDGELLITDQLYYDTENEWLFTEDKFEYTDKSNKIIANRLDSNRDFTDLVTGNLTGSINITDQ
ncbi:MAG: LPS export ABC transporter periplasmic protein LptC [Bacteroidetes bacterium]|nr:LPS export ABC transporter periplasmic protein LptC [Flavobacteriaceae bacterium]MDA0331201.1 LPS export ABC transporter periplasmic protein LptC [Bacteroidota bacterium]MDA0885138.1 LPS export ABC transporter periplasmic protein LptC [Bacteroidota bacterium]MDA1225284.1 LPS export ABC transporter periplasmic protein LptC [Bacteroidota bacterium]